MCVVCTLNPYVLLYSIELQKILAIFESITNSLSLLPHGHVKILYTHTYVYYKTKKSTSLLHFDKFFVQYERVFTDYDMIPCLCAT